MADAEAERVTAERKAKSEAERAEAERKAKVEADRIAQAERDAAAEREAQAEAKRAQKAAKEAAMLAEQSKHDQEKPDSVAAKLARIRADVGQPATPPAAPAYSEDEHAEDIMQGQLGDTDLEDILDLDDAADD